MSRASRHAGLAGSKTHPSGTTAAVALRNDRTRNCSESKRAKKRKKQNEIPMAAISGCIKNATSSSGTACQRFPSRMRHTASRIMAVARVARVQVLIGHVQRRPCNRQREHRRHQRDPCPSRGFFKKQQVRDFLDCPQNQKQRRQLPNQLRPASGILVHRTKSAIQLSNSVAWHCSRKKLEL